jgi:GntR family transcriptional repressor for pyruvate dehydrogenase complex
MDPPAAPGTRGPRARAFHAIVAQLQADIFAQRRRPGDRLPTEQQLGEQFGVSRTGVREALRVLELQGLVEVRHGYGGGVFVAAPSTRPLRGALHTSLRLGQVDVVELYQARMLIEPMLVRQAVERDAAGLAARLHTNIRAARAALAAGGHGFAVSREFHALIAAAAGNRVLGLLMQALLDLLDELEQQVPGSPAISCGALREHERLLAAIRAGDAAWAERAMAVHLQRLGRQYQHLQHAQNRRGGTGHGRYHVPC